MKRVKVGDLVRVDEPWNRRSIVGKVVSVDVMYPGAERMIVVDHGNGKNIGHLVRSVKVMVKAEVLAPRRLVD